ncbi:MAG: CHAD domain-containing protein [Nitrospira sp. CR2.1]|nr:CHAD domain-containing protein [Nitrospira sp. CR2.1]
MTRPDSPIHTGRTSRTQQLNRTALAYQATVLQLIARLLDENEPPEVVHALRTHMRRVQALLELYGDADNARLMARCVGRLSKLRALHVFRQYLVTIDASQADLALVDARIHKQARKLRQAGAYETIAQAVRELPFPSPTESDARLLERLDAVRHDHRRRLRRLVEAARDSPRRKRLHALRLRLKTVRYQGEWFEQPTDEHRALQKKLVRLQGLLGTYEELADFRRWGKRLSTMVQGRIRNDWKKARKRAKAAPAALSWLRRALSTNTLWRPP